MTLTFNTNMAEDIYTAAGWESMYQNGYLHGSPSKFSAKSAIYTAAGCQHIIAIYTAAVPEQIQTIYTAAVCPHKIAIYTAAIQEPNRLYTLLPVVYKKSLFTRQPFKSQIGYIHCCRVQTKIVIYTAAFQEQTRLNTLLPGVYVNCYLHGSHSRANSAIYIAAGCIYMKLLFTGQPFKSQIDCATTAQLIGGFVFTYVKS